MKIVIVGGGTAGWSAAAILSNTSIHEVTIIEPSDIPTIGVGESTIPAIHTAHKEMGFDAFQSVEWLDEVDATLKFSIEFADYYKKNSRWIHPFISRHALWDYEGSARICSGEVEIPEELDQYKFISERYSLPNLRMQRFVPSHEQMTNPYTRQVGFHLNAGKYAQMLKRLTLERNVTYIDAHVTKVHAENKHVRKIDLSDGTTLEADLFVDCTGFRALLANAIESEWVSYSDRLFVDRAWVVQLPYINPSVQMRNTTYCHALGNGWCWNVPLQSRIGTGYIFSSRHTSNEAAAEEFKQHLSETYGYDPQTLEFKLVQFQVGYRPQAWTNNVVAIGLSAFFLEPIESTAIATFQNQIIALKSMIDSDHITWDNKVNRFNTLFSSSLEGIREYVELHYIFTKRDDTQFWKDYSCMPLTETQRVVLDIYTDPDRLYDPRSVKLLTSKHSMFDYSSYMFLFLGFDIRPNVQCEFSRSKLINTYKHD